MDKCARLLGGYNADMCAAARKLEAPAGLLRPKSYGEAVRLFRAPPSEDLASLVELLWGVTWDLERDETRTQETLPYPNVHLVVESGQALVYGVSRNRFTRSLHGRGSVLGIKFHPGGLRPLMNQPVSSLRGRSVPAERVIAADTGPLVSAVLGAEGSPAQALAAEQWLRGLDLPADPRVREAAEAVAAIAADPAVLRVEELARRLATSTRSLQRLFSEYVGVGPKWVVRRFRMHEAAARAASGPVDWATLALDLGYCDQSHFVRDFTSAVGVSPASYAAQCTP